MSNCELIKTKHGSHLMFFKKKSPQEKLQAKYEKLMSEAHKLSVSNRSKSDAKYAEAFAISKKIDELNAQT